MIRFLSPLTVAISVRCGAAICKCKSQTSWASLDKQLHAIILHQVNGMNGRIMHSIDSLKAQSRDLSHEKAGKRHETSSGQWAAKARAYRPSHGRGLGDLGGTSCQQTNNKFLVCSQRGLVTWDICPSQLESLDETGFAVLVESFDE